MSLESLVDWNPANWEAAADRNLNLFGEDACIIITVREPLAWMTSVYQQKIQEGNIVKPNHFFLKREDYFWAKQISNSSKLEYFCPDYVDYYSLKEIYTSRFRTVKFVDISQLKSMEFLDGLFDVEDNLRKSLIKSFRSAPRKNRAYSSSAMSLTFRREKFFRMLGAKSIGSSDQRLENLGHIWDAKVIPAPVTFRNLNFYQKIVQFPFRFLRRVFNPFSKWRLFIKNVYDKLIPYRKYELPSDVYLNRENIEKCRMFIQDLKK